MSYCSEPMPPLRKLVVCGRRFAGEGRKPPE
jgi:hypothetical protein